MLTTFKPVAEKTLTPVARVLQNVPPNVLTLLGLVFPVLFFVFTVKGMYALALVMLVLNVADMLDGLVARSQNKVTAFGGFLDSTVDRFADFTVLAAFAFADIVSWEIMAPLLMLTYLISYIRSRTELAAKGNLVAAVGIIERTERFVAIFVAMLLFALWPDVSLSSFNLAELTFVVLGILSVVTVGQRVRFAYRNL